MKSVQFMLAKVEGLLKYNDLEEYERKFVESISNRVKAKNGSTSDLTEKQINWIEKIYKANF